MSTDTGPHVLIIAGMHRSGTSLLANWLARCGLDVGDELLHTSIDNPNGHYEDLSFLNLHNHILRHNGLDYLVGSEQTITLNEADRVQAQALISAKQGRTQWGWKDPRTALFLDFWDTLLPDVKILVVFRHYTYVVDSLLRRDYKRALHKKKLTPWQRRLEQTQKVPSWFKRLPVFLRLFGAGERFVRAQIEHFRYSFVNLGRLRRYLAVWERYNRDILAFIDAHPDRALVIHIDDLFLLSAQVVDYLNREWGFDLRPAAVEEAYEEGALNTERMWLREKWCAALRPTCQQTYEMLTARRDETYRKLAARQTEQER